MYTNIPTQQLPDIILNALILNNIDDKDINAYIQHYIKKKLFSV